MRIINTVLFAAIVFTLSCNNKQEAIPGDSSVISDSMVNSAQTATASSEEQMNTIRLNGKVEPDESRLAKVYALVSGKIQSVNVELGDYVQKGQTLAVLNSTEVAGLSNDLVMAEGNVALTKKNMETTKDLYEGKLATEQQYISAIVDYNRAQSELNRIKQVTSIMGGKNATYTVVAPITGYVIEKNITSNSAVRPDNSTSLFSVADLSTIWVTANVYEADITDVHPGDSVIVNTLARPDKNYYGTVGKIYNVLDPATRTMKIRISMNNSNGELKPEMFATVKVNCKPSGKALGIPSQAIVLDKSKNYVVIKTGKKLEVREVQLIKRTESRAFVTGLSVGDTVVTSGQVFFYQALTKL